MRVVLTGATGFVGRACARALADDGHRVRAALRRGRPPAAGEAWEDAIEIGDVGMLPAADKPEEWLVRRLEGVDVLIHLAARVHVMRDEDEAAFHRVNTLGTAALASAAQAAGVGRFVFMSTIKVNGETTSAPFSETDPPAPVGAYARSKKAAEDALAGIAAQRAGMEMVVLRPPLVYGPGVRANFRRLLEAVRKRRPLPLGGARNRRTMIYVENLARAVTLAARVPAAAGQTYLVGDAESLTPEQLVRQIAAGMGLRPRLLPAPIRLLRAAAALGDVVRRAVPFPVGTPEVDRLFGSLELDISKARRQLGYEPAVDAAQAIRMTAQAHLLSHSTR